MAIELNRIIPDNGSNTDYDTGLSASNKLNENFQSIETTLEDKVVKIDGKGLSTNDYSNAEKQKVTDLVGSLNGINQVLPALSQKNDAQDGAIALRQMKLEGTFSIQYWQEIAPSDQIGGDILYNPIYKEMIVWISVPDSGFNPFWLTITIADKFVYTFDGNYYLWTGTDMLQISEKGEPVALLSVTTVPPVMDYPAGSLYYSSMDRAIIKWNSAMFQWDEAVAPKVGVIYTFGENNYMLKDGSLVKVGAGGGTGGVTDYNDLDNLPDLTLKADKVILTSVTNAPAIVTTKDLYFNSTDKLIYHVINDGGLVWEDEAPPVPGTIYICQGTSYMWDGIKLFPWGTDSALEATLLGAINTLVGYEAVRAESAETALSGRIDGKEAAGVAAGLDASVLSTAKSYADGLVVGLWDDRGGFDASVNTYPTTGGSGASGAILKGDIWTINVIATAGDLLGYRTSSTLRALCDTPAQVATNWAVEQHESGYVPENLANKDVSGGYAGLTLFKINLKNTLGTITNFISSSSTGVRNWIMPDKDGTVAMLSDIPAQYTDANSIAAALTGLTQSATLVTVVATDSQLTAWGKFMKLFSALKALAFKDSIDYTSTDITNKPTIPDTTKAYSDPIPLYCSDLATDLTASTSVSRLHFIFNEARTWTGIIGDLTVASVGGTFTVSVKKTLAGVTNDGLSTNLTFNSGSSTTRTATVPAVLSASPTNFAIGDSVDIYINSIGSSTPGRGLIITLLTNK